MEQQLPVFRAQWNECKRAAPDTRSDIGRFAYGTIFVRLNECTQMQNAGYHRGHRDSQRVMVAGDVIISPNVICTVAIGRVQILSRVIYADFVEEPFDLFVDLGSLADD